MSDPLDYRGSPPLTAPLPMPLYGVAAAGVLAYVVALCGAAAFGMADSHRWDRVDEAALAALALPCGTFAPNDAVIAVPFVLVLNASIWGAAFAGVAKVARRRHRLR